MLDKTAMFKGAGNKTEPTSSFKDLILGKDTGLSFSRLVFVLCADSSAHRLKLSPQKLCSCTVRERK